LYAVKKNRDIALWFLLILLSFGCWAQQVSGNLGVYFNFLKELEFAQANQSILEIDDLALKKSLLLLSDILENNGQTSNFPTIITKADEYKGKGDLNISIFLLIKSNAQIAFNNTNVTTYKNLIRALAIAKKINNKPLIKFTLLSILEFYKKYLIQVNDLYLNHLNEYKNYVEDDADFAHFALNNFIFEGRSPREIDHVFHQSSFLLDSIHSYFDESSKLEPLFRFEKGMYYKITNKNDLAKEFFQSTIDLTTNQFFYRYINFGAYLKLSEIASEQGDFYLAVSLLDKAQIYVDKSQPLINQYYYNNYISKYYEKLENHEYAFKHLKKALQLKLKIDEINSQIGLEAASIEYQTEKKDQQIIVEQNRTNIRTNWLMAAIVLLILGSVVAILLQKNTSKKRTLAEQGREIQRQRAENLLKEQELLSIDAMIAGQEKERQYVANELHDDLGGLMATIQLHFENIKTTKKD